MSIRLIAVAQALAFGITCMARAVQHRAITTLELTTLAYIPAMLATSCFWKNKVQDVSKAEVLKTKTRISQIVEEVWRAGPSIET